MKKQAKLLHDLSNKLLALDFNVKKLGIYPADEIAYRKASEASRKAIDILMELKKLEREVA